MQKKKKKVDFEVDSQGSNTVKLSPVETEILHLLTVEFLTPKQVSNRRGTTSEATYKIIRKLKEKGLINRYFQKVDFFQCPTQPKSTFEGLRVHGLEFNIKLIYKSEKYRCSLLKGNIFVLDGNTIRLYSDSLEVYGNKSFYGEDENKAMRQVFNYFNRFFIKLESHLKIVIVKPRSQNISIVKCEFAEVNNELARDCGDKSEKIKVFTRGDGKLWFLIDNSFNLHEIETVHRDTAKRDMQAVRKQFNDMRDNNPPTLSEVLELIYLVTEQNKETAAGLTSVVELMKPKNKLEPKEEKLKRRPEYIG